MLALTPVRREMDTNGPSPLVDIEIERNHYTQEKLDNEVAAINYARTHPANQEDHEVRRSYLGRFRDYCRPRCSRMRRPSHWFHDVLGGIFPVLRWLPRYDFRNDFVSDLIAGITVGIMHIPQGMAYASLAGMPPVYGLYTSFFPTLIYFLMGTSGHVSIGTFAVASLMVGTVRYRFVPEELDPLIDPASANASASALRHVNHLLPGNITISISPVEVTAALTFLVGIIQVGMAVLRLGFVTVFLSDQLVSGFTTGAAVMVFTSQVNKALGVKLPRYEGVGKLYFTYRDLMFLLPQSNPLTLVITLLCIVTIFVVKGWLSPIFSRRFKVPFPIDLVVIILFTVVSYLANLEEKYDVKIVDHIPAGLPSPIMPPVQLFPHLVGDAFVIAVIVFAITVSMGKIFAKRHGYKVDPNQEMFALGVIHAASSCFQCIVTCASLTRTVVLNELSARSQVALSHEQLALKAIACELRHFTSLRHFLLFTASD